MYTRYNSMHPRAPAAAPAPCAWSPGPSAAALRDRERALARMAALHQRHRPVESELGMIGIEPQRALERILRVRAPPRTQQGHRHAQEGAGQIAPLVLTIGGGSVPRLEARGEP